jgi:hypothetical protein
VRFEEKKLTEMMVRTESKVRGSEFGIVMKRRRVVGAFEVRREGNVSLVLSAEGVASNQSTITERDSWISCWFSWLKRGFVRENGELVSFVGAESETLSSEKKIVK